MGADAPVKVRQGKRWAWSWRGWTSSAHEVLEERAWTPLVIADKLCFSALDGQKWSVVHGDLQGKKYDDAYDTEDFEGQPVYIAREGEEYMLVLGTRESRRYPYQITFRIKGGKVRLYRFTQEPPSGPGLEPLWR
jgi:hypothetical protein